MAKVRSFDTHMRKSLSLATVLAALCVSPTLQAQSEEGPAGVAQLEPVVVTGTALQRAEAENNPAIVVLDSKKIERSGAQTLNALLGRRVPQNTLGLNENVANGRSFAPGAAAASLRGLGVTATLVLINGRRVAPFAFAQGGTDTFVDLNSIPLSAIERVEILREGASAIYGSEAIAGVINVILKSDYTGFETETYYGNTTRGDAGEFRKSFVTGLDSGKLHLFLSGHYFHRDPIAAVDRSYSASADQSARGGGDFRSEEANPGTIYVGKKVFAVPAGSDGRLTVGEFLPGQLSKDGPLRNRYDYNRDSELVAETERWGGLLTFRYELAPQLQLFGEVSYQSVDSKTRIEPTPVNSELGGLVVPASNPFNPFGQAVDFSWLALETGLRRNRVEGDAYRYLAGLRAHGLPGDWTAEAAFLYSESNVVDHATDGYLSRARVQAALDDSDPATALNVFGDGRDINNPATLRGLVFRPRTDGLAYISSVDFKAHGTLFQLPAGPVILGVGGEYREEFYSQRFSEKPDAAVVYGSALAEGDRDVRSLFFEARVPLAGPSFNLPMLRKLELTIAERLDHYSDYGQTVKPKFGLEWKPCSGLLMRGSYSEGFRAPSLPQLFGSALTGFTSVEDPETKEDETVAYSLGGISKLRPELSYSYFLGGTIEPPFIEGLSVSLDYFHLEQRNLIGLPFAQDIVDGKVPEGEIDRGRNGGILRVRAPFLNFGTTVIEGWDFDVAWRRETRFGAFELISSLAYVTNLNKARRPGAPSESELDQFGFPEFKMVHSLFYSLGGFEAGVTLNYVDSYDDDSANRFDRPRTVGSWTTVDLQVSYEWRPASPGESAGRWRWLDHARLTVGCLNLGDSEPPFFNNELGYDPQNADAAGRFIYATLRKKF